MVKQPVRETLHSTATVQVCVLSAAGHRQLISLLR